MLNQSNVKIEKYGMRKTMIVDGQNVWALPCKVSNSGVTANSEGKKIVKMGTPLYGDLKARNTAFTISGTTGAKPVGLLQSDVDVTNANANGSIVFFAMIDVTKLDSDIQSKITADVESALNMIKFIK